jgi:WD40 repeat protein/serine/threonine protein kinase
MTEQSLPEESLFAQALEIESAAARAAFLDRACADNPALRAEVEALLRAHERSGDLLDLPENLPATTDLPACERPGTILGPYKLLEQIGEGGMGTVWMAEQTEPMRRRVAVKVVKEGMDSRQVLARFDAERQALALMEHPNIARVLDAGRTASGRPYFVMELVKGQPITKYCDDKRFGVRERLELFGDVCRAVQHAHQKGIIHRDLKPSNVLVAPYDGKPVIKVIDFGVAKATGQRLTDYTLFTGFGALVGTPEYMSPEQAEANNQDIDTRSDIYALGVLMDELLTGSTPLTRQRVKEAALLEVLRVIREEEPPRPSTRLSESKDSLPSISAQRQIEPAKLTRVVRGELDWIVMKALEKDRNRRYETANGFAQDVQRYLADEPVQACPPSAWYRIRKFVRRHRRPVLAAAVILLLLIGGIIGTSVGLVQATVSDERAQSAAIKAGEERDAANEARTAETVQRKRAEDLGKELRQKLYVAQMNMAGEAAGSPLGLGRVAELLSPWREGQPDLRGWEWYYLYGQSHQELLTIPAASRSGPQHRCPTWSPDSKRLVSAGNDGTVKTWDAATGKDAVIFEMGYQDRSLHSPFLAFSADGSQLACAWPGGTAIWDAATAKRRLTIVPGTGRYCGVAAWDPDCGRLALVDNNAPNDIQILDVNTGKTKVILKGNAASPRSAAWSHDGKRLASLDLQGKLRIWDLATAKVSLDIKLDNPPWSAGYFSWSPDDRRLVYGDQMGLLTLWDTATGKRLVARQFNRSVRGVAWSPEGTRLAFGTNNGEVMVVEAATEVTLYTLGGHSTLTDDVAWSPDGTRLVSIDNYGVAKIWDANQPVQIFDPTGGTRTVSWSPNGKRLASVSARGHVRIWNGVTRAGPEPFKDTVTLTDQAAPARDVSTRVSWSPDGTRLASPNGAAIQIWDAATGKELSSLKGKREVRSLAWSPDGRRLASAEEDGAVGIWDSVTRKQTLLRRVEPGEDPVPCVAWNPAGTRLAAACNSGCVLIWDAITGQLTSMIRGHRGVVTSVAWCPKGTRLASAGRDREIHVWDASTGRVLGTLKEHTGMVDQVSWSPDGKRLASCSWDQTVKLWDPITGETVITFHFLPKSEIPACLAWSPGGSRLAVGCGSGSIEILDAAPGYRLAGHPLPGKPE